MFFISLLTGLLKIIALLLIVALILIAVLLFVPVRYDVFAEKSDALNIKAIATWFFRAVKVYYKKTPKKSSMKIIIFGKLIGGKRNKKSARKKERGEAPKIERDISRDVEIPNRAENVKPETDCTEPYSKAINKTREIKPEKLPKHKKKKKEKHKEKKYSGAEDEPVESRLKQALSLYNHPDRNEIIRLTLQLCVKLLKALKPQNFALNAAIGVGDPAATGYVIGFCETIKPFLGFDATLKGNFEEAELSGDIKIKGNLFLYKFLYPLCKYALARPVWKIIKKYFLKKDDKK